MAHSRHTDPPFLYVKDRYPRDDEGRPIFPRVVRRRPRRGDIHPIERKPLSRAMRFVPLEYLYGLNQIELRPRVDQAGQPYGFYSPSDKLIVLYSAPTSWELGAVSEQASLLGAIMLYKEYGAEVKREHDRLTVHWPDPVGLEKLYFWHVFLHELGHHYSNQWKRRRKRPPWGKYQEIIAELHRQKLSTQVVSKFLELFKSDDRLEP